MNHSINIAAKRSGLSAHVIRVWEKRYNAVAPVRTETNRRQYSDEEIERLVLLKQATDAGYKISQIAPISTENLVDLLAKENLHVSQSSPVESQPASVEGHEGTHLVSQCLASIQKLDSTALEETLTQSALSLGHQGMIRLVVAPLAVELGEKWQEGSITAAHEHFASAIIRVFLTNISKPFAIPESAPRIVVATPAGQLHELGAIIAGATCSSAGWQVTYLGTNLPAAEIAGACIQNQAVAVALSIVYPHDDPDLGEDLKRLRKFVPTSVSIIAGGRAADSYEKELQAAGISLCLDIRDFTKQLDLIRSSGPN